LSGLDEQSQVMTDKITTIRATRLREHIGRLSDEEIVELNRSMTTFLGMAGPQPAPAPSPPAR